MRLCCCTHLLAGTTVPPPAYSRKCCPRARDSQMHLFSPDLPSQSQLPSWMSNQPLGTLPGPVQASTSEVKIIPSLWLMLNQSPWISLGPPASTPLFCFILQPDFSRGGLYRSPKFSSLLQCCLTPQTLNLLSFILEIAALILVLPWPHPHCLVGCKDSAPMVLFLVMFFPNHVKHSFTISHIPARSSLELGKLKGPLLFCLHRSLNQGREVVNT